MRSPTNRYDVGGAASVQWLSGVVTFAGRQDNLAIRQAAVVALAFNVLMVAAAVISIMLTVPKGRRQEEERQ